MKKNKLTTLAALLVATATLTVTSSQALTSIQVKEIKNAVLSVPLPEMPAKAADLVKSAEKKDRQATAVTAVRAIVVKHRAAAPLVISAISKVAPDLAPAVAVAAAEVANDQAPLIARAAAISAPEQAAQITTAVAKAVPGKATSVASTVNRAITRGSAHEGAPSQGAIVVTDTPINNSPFGFSDDPPAPAADPIVLYNTPPQG